MNDLSRLLIAALVVATTSASAAQLSAIGVSWEIENTEGFGFVTAAARCGDTLLLGDGRKQLVHRYDIGTQRSLPPFDVGPMLGLTAECASSTLYVVSVTADGNAGLVKQLDLDSGAQRADFPLPPTFAPRSAVWTDSNAVMIGGLWEPSEGDSDAFYEGRSLALRLSLDTGATEPTLPAYELSCPEGFWCSQVRAHGSRRAGGGNRIAALPLSTDVGIYAGNQLPRRVSVASPQLLRDGSRPQPGMSGADFVEWTATNATLDGVFAFAGGFAVEHRSSALEVREPGGPIPKRVHVSTYGWDGVAKRIDIPVPGPIIGVGDGMLYTVDDNDASGSHIGSTRIRVVELPLDELR